MDIIDRRRKAPVLSNFLLIEKRMGKLDPQKLADMAIEDQAARMGRLHGLIEAVVPAQFRELLLWEISGVVAGEITIANSETRIAVRTLKQETITEKARLKRERERQITWEVRQRYPDLVPKSLKAEVDKARASAVPPLEAIPMTTLRDHLDHLKKEGSRL